MRAPRDVAVRYEAITDDMFGFKAEVLFLAMDYDAASPWLRPEVEESGWEYPMTEEAFRAEAVEYLAFAFGKARDHRGISASRSVDKMGEFLWVLELDRTGFDAAGYAPYGVPKLVAAATQLGVEWPRDDADLVRMAAGEPCSPDCVDGCRGL